VVKINPQNSTKNLNRRQYRGVGLSLDTIDSPHGQSNKEGITGLKLKAVREEMWWCSVRKEGALRGEKVVGGCARVPYEVSLAGAMALGWREESGRLGFPYGVKFRVLDDEGGRE
jgi:hypothetical protein